MRPESQETVLVGMASAGPMQQQPRQASPGQQRQEPVGVRNLGGGNYEESIPLGTRGNTQVVAPGISVDPVPRGTAMPKETTGNQLRAQRAGNRHEMEENEARAAVTPAGTPLGTAESASSAVYAPRAPEVPEYSLRYQPQAFRADNSVAVTFENRQEPPGKYGDMGISRNHVWMEAIGSVRSRNTGYGAILPHPTVPGIERRNLRSALYVTGIDRDVKEQHFIHEFM
eukprot:317244-Alexandrium_andersonii.AAC.1